VTACCSDTAEDTVEEDTEIDVDEDEGSEDEDRPRGCRRGSAG
jgi:hypothetical protein